MAIDPRRETVGTDPVKLTSTPGDTTPAASIAIVPSDGDITLGKDDQVTVGAGFIIGPTGDQPAITVDRVEGEDVWAVAAADVDVAIFEQGL